MVDLLLTASFVAGIALLAYGCWLAWHPAGFIVAGVVLVLVSLLTVRGRWASSTS